MAILDCKAAWRTIKASRPARLTELFEADAQRVGNFSRDVASIHFDWSKTHLDEEVLGAFAVLAFGLGVLGVFAVTAYSVQQRLREFGVRIALGATVSDVIRIVAMGAARLTVFGIAAGLAGVVLLSRWITTFLFGIPALDATTLGRLRAGDRVNLEIDLIARYVARLAGFAESIAADPVRKE